LENIHQAFFLEPPQQHKYVTVVRNNRKNDNLFMKYFYLFFVLLFLDKGFLLAQESKVNKTICCQYPEVIDNFATEKPMHHYYKSETPIFSNAQYPSATISKLYELFLQHNNYVAPTFDTNPVENCKKVECNFLTLAEKDSAQGNFIFNDPIITVINRQNYSVINYTLEEHRLHAGKVIRQIIQKQGIFYIRSIGVGNNKDKISYYFNNSQFLMDLFWAKVDDIFITDAKKIFANSSSPIISSQEELKPGARLLFAGAKVNLTNKEKNEIFISLGFTLSADKKTFIQDIQDEDNERAHFATVVSTYDLDRDGINELFIHWGNSYTSGFVGQTVTLFINICGKYKKSLETEGFANPTSRYFNGFSDIIISGPGFDFPLWRWNGQEYVFVKEINQASNEFRKLKLFDLSKDK
jgi:hypothetical protein